MMTRLKCCPLGMEAGKVPVSSRFVSTKLEALFQNPVGLFFFANSFFCFQRRRRQGRTKSYCGSAERMRKKHHEFTMISRTEVVADSQNTLEKLASSSSSPAHTTYPKSISPLSSAFPAHIQCTPKKGRMSGCAYNGSTPQKSFPFRFQAPPIFSSPPHSKSLLGGRRRRERRWEKTGFRLLQMQREKRRMM